MFTLAGMRTLHRWTHGTVTMALDHLATLPQSTYEKELPGFGFPSLRAQVLHIFNCEGFWVHTLQRTGFRDHQAADFPTAADARTLQANVRAYTAAYLDELSEAQLNADTELRFSDGDRAVRTPALVLHHVVTHAFHHKGQLVSMCRALGHPAPDTDLNRLE